ncbi:hypothetical protein [Tsukamurella sp. USMM236]|uniref:hypothetical protein n=1 Tax=Tsukamurella sp. USMM236 TaxID=3081301 RepID=UPI00301B4B9F
MRNTNDVLFAAMIGSSDTKLVSDSTASAPVGHELEIVSGTEPTPDREDLNVPDRFEMIRSSGTGTLRSLISPVDESLEALDERFVDLRAARRGGFVVLRGEPGAGKSTFLDTVHLFREGVVTERVAQEEDIAERLRRIGASENARVIVIEGREALLDVTEPALEASMHAINTFVRSSQGADTLVVWPTNTDPLMKSLVELGTRLGGKALMGHDGGVLRFVGPPQSAFTQIAERTIAALNDGASLSALGISEERAREIALREATIGDYLGAIRRELLRNDAKVKKLLKVEQFRLWVVVVAGNDVEGDVAALTRGGFAYADIDRLINSTGANIVQELKKRPDDLGILGTVLDVKVIHLDVFTALAIARQHANEKLRELMKAEGMSVSKDRQADSRLMSSELGLIMAGKSLGTRRRGIKPGGNTKTAFEGLARIARNDDGLLNRAIGEGLLSSGLVASFEAEKPLGTTLRYDSDLYVMRDGEPTRVEVMWLFPIGSA